MYIIVSIYLFVSFKPYNVQIDWMETAGKSQSWKGNLWPIFPLLDWCDWVVVHHLCTITCAFVDPRQNMCAQAWWASGTSSSRFSFLKCETLNGLTNGQIISFQLFLSAAALWSFCRFLAHFMHGRWNCLWIFLKVIWEDTKKKYDVHILCSEWIIV